MATRREARDAEGKGGTADGMRRQRWRSVTTRRVSSETQVEVVEIITQLKVRNPTLTLTEALTLLNNNWILA